MDQYYVLGIPKIIFVGVVLSAAIKFKHHAGAELMEVPTLKRRVCVGDDELYKGWFVPNQYLIAKANFRIVLICHKYSR
jgi:hypothetical protein